MVVTEAEEVSADTTRPDGKLEPKKVHHLDFLFKAGFKVKVTKPRTDH